ncbi:MAG: hypothetical protein L6R37_005888 [Teloschistes peruensis]|nr:MAG: hypothetical protein L6R37_005888 [Teloschistes peruensis]
MAFPPPTPPSSAPTSPKSPTSSDGDCIINIGGDEEKHCSDEKHLPYETEKAQSPSVTTGVDDHPRGYPTLAAYMNSSDNFLMCRRFSFLQTRVLLYRQDELAEMEDTLLNMDDEDKDLEPLALQSRRLDGDRTEEPSRASLIEKIDSKLKQYGTSMF